MEEAQQGSFSLALKKKIRREETKYPSQLQGVWGDVPPTAPPPWDVLGLKERHQWRVAPGQLPCSWHNGTVGAASGRTGQQVDPPVLTTVGLFKVKLLVTPCVSACSILTEHRASNNSIVEKCIHWIKRSTFSQGDCFAFYFSSFSVSFKCLLISFLSFEHSHLRAFVSVLQINRSFTCHWKINVLCSTVEVAPLNIFALICRCVSTALCSDSGLWCTSVFIVAAGPTQGGRDDAWGLCQGQLCGCQRSWTTEMTAANHPANSCAASTPCRTNTDWRTTSSWPQSLFSLEATHADVDGFLICFPVQQQDSHC